MFFVFFYILQAIKNWIVGRPGNEASCAYVTIPKPRCAWQLVQVITMDLSVFCNNMRKPHSKQIQVLNSVRFTLPKESNGMLLGQK